MIIGTDICKHEYQSKFYYTSNKKLKKMYCNGYKKYESVPKNGHVWYNIQLMAFG